jgi:protein-S-isoprenylcysteine O-methyltransferase Ste14
MFKTKKVDWYFIVPASLVWISALIVTAWDFLELQKAADHFGFASLVGLIFMVTGVGIRVVARKTLGKQFSYALRILEKHELVRDGIYEHVRHPAYSGDLLFNFGTPLLFSSWYGFLVILLLIPCILYRIRIEESMLVERFGDEYRKYRQTSKKLIPYLY